MSYVQTWYEFLTETFLASRNLLVTQIPTGGRPCLLEPVAFKVTSVFSIPTNRKDSRLEECVLALHTGRAFTCSPSVECNHGDR